MLVACASTSETDSDAPATFSMAGCRQVETSPDAVITRLYFDEARLLEYDVVTPEDYDHWSFTHSDACILSVAWTQTWGTADTQSVEAGTRECDEARNVVHTWTTTQATTAGTTTTSALELLYANSYDESGQLVHVVKSAVDAGGAAAPYLDTVYTWESGHVVQEQATDTGGDTWVTTYTWDADRLVASTVLSSEGDQHRQTYAYDVDGRLIEYTTADDAPDDTASFADWQGERYTYTDATPRVRRTEFSAGTWDAVVRASTSTWYCPD